MLNFQRFLLVLIFVAIGGLSAFAQPVGAGLLELPDVEGWVKSEVKQFPQAELGYRVHYDSTIGGTVSIYVYNGGIESIPSGIEDTVIKDEIENVYSGILQAVELGMNGYEKVEALQNDVIILGGKGGSIRVRRRVMDLTVSGRELTSEIYIFGYDGDFIKLRSTRAREIEGLQNKAVTDLFVALDKYFASSPKPAGRALEPAPNSKTRIKN